MTFERDLLAGKRVLVTLGAEAGLAAVLAVALLEAGGFEPGYALASGVRAAPAKRKIIGGSAKPPPFVVDGEAHGPNALTSLSRPSATEDVLLFTDRISIVAGDPPLIVPSSALVVTDARGAVALSPEARATVYGLDGDDDAGITPTWLAAPIDPEPGSLVRPFDLYAGGSYFGRFAIGTPDRARVATTLGALVACAEGFGVDIEKARRVIAAFEGWA